MNRIGFTPRRSAAALLALLVASCGMGAGEKSVGLAEFEWVPPVLELGPGVEDLSGLAFDPDTGTLWGILNGTPELIEFTRAGEILRRVALRGFDDTEDLARLGRGRFVVVEERLRMVRWLAVPGLTGAVDVASAPGFLLDPVPAGNVGLEGIAWDGRSNRYFAVKEKDPLRVYAFDAPRGGQPPAVTHPWDAATNALGLTDLSAIHWDAGTGHLLLLSHESRCAVEVRADGAEVGRLSLRAGSAGLREDVPQAEGITRDDRGWLYVASEPNRVYAFRPREAKAPQPPSGR